MKLEYLIGKSIFELILEFPKIEWQMYVGLDLQTREKIREISIVHYDTKKPRRNFDMFIPVQLEKISNEPFGFLRKLDPHTTTGIVSKVVLDQPQEYLTNKYAHIPMLDFDLSQNLGDLKEEDILKIITNNIKCELEINHGAILRSGPRKNYHFIGLGQLLTEQNFLTFLGMALLLRHEYNGQHVDLVDSRYCGHALSPMKYLSQIQEPEEKNPFLLYDMPNVFTSLRITPKPDYKSNPEVVAVF